MTVNNVTIASSRRSIRVLETSHPPVFYIPPDDVLMEHLEEIGRRSWCEWKGTASYFNVRVGERLIEAAAWCYHQPVPGFEAIRDHIAFYPGRMDQCRLDNEIVKAQPGDFYGGWITTEIVGPFKGDPGTMGW